MPTKSPHPQQPSFEEQAAIDNDPDLQNLLRCYPDQHDLIIRAYRRRRPHDGCTCPWGSRKPNGCCRPLPPSGPRRRTPSRAGQYRHQLHR